MFCPKCSQEQISSETKFCSRCGFLMTGVVELVKNNGNAANTSFLEKIAGDSPRKKGVKQGLFIFSLSFLIVPIVAILTVAFDSDPYVVAITAILLSVGGLLRMIYALLLQTNEPALGKTNSGSDQTVLSTNTAGRELPAAISQPVSDFIPPIQGNWRNTNDLIPTSVTEETTNLLNKELKNEIEVK
jgi:hypothetical protein